MRNSKTQEFLCAKFFTLGNSKPRPTPIAQISTKTRAILGYNNSITKGTNSVVPFPSTISLIVATSFKTLPTQEFPLHHNATSNIKRLVK